VASLGGSENAINKKGAALILAAPDYLT